MYRRYKIGFLGKGEYKTRVVERQRTIVRNVIELYAPNPLRLYHRIIKIEERK